MIFRSIVVLTGAGLSAESGLGTFRDKGGLWEEFDLEEVATPEGFARNPARCTNSTISAGGGLAMPGRTPLIMR
jgi:NAD-dependent SIR2 family protein deacetylase